jgi:hypothetical protein
MSIEAWFWLVLNIVLIGWLIRCVREPIAMPDDRLTRVRPLDKPREGGYAEEQDSL